MYHSVIADCMSLSSPQNGDIQFTSTLQGSVATYSCITGYTVVGPSNRTCLSSGLWSDSDPTCECKVVMAQNRPSLLYANKLLCILWL